MGSSPQGRHSPDKAWWWSGAQWVPAWSPDGAWWFDGVTWRAGLANGQGRTLGPWRRLTRSETVVGALWFALWLVSALWAAVTVPKAQSERSPVSSGAWLFGITLGGSAVLATIATAAWLAYRGRWWAIWLLALYVAGLFFAWYLAAMFSVPVPAGQPDTQDDAAAVGLFFLALPTAAGVGLLVSLGTGVGATIRAVRRRKMRRSV